jgi:hypothetical protein
MIDASRRGGDQAGFAETGRAETPSPFNGPDRPRFSFGVSLFAAMLLITALSTLLWPSSNSPKFNRFEDPERALDLMVSRTMEAQDGLLLAPDWQQRVTEWTAGSNDVERAQAIQWYQELVAATASPAAKLRLAILQAESGHQSEALAAATIWAGGDAPLSLYAEFIDAAYGEGSLASEREMKLQSALAEALPAGWFYNHLAAALAERAGDGVLGATVREQMHARGARIQAFSQLLTGLELLGLIGGSLMLLRFAWLKIRRVDGLRLHQPGVPPPWPGGIGTAVLLRGGALGAVLSLAFFVAPRASRCAPWRSMANLPLLGMAYYYLLRPSGLNHHRVWLADSVAADRRLAVFSRSSRPGCGAKGDGAGGGSLPGQPLGNSLTPIWSGPQDQFDHQLAQYVVFSPIFESGIRGICGDPARQLDPLPAASSTPASCPTHSIASSFYQRAVERRALASSMSEPESDPRHDRVPRIICWCVSMMALSVSGVETGSLRSRLIKYQRAQGTPPVSTHLHLFKAG